MDKELEVLSAKLMGAKRDEALTKSVRIHIEEKIAELMSGPPEGTVSDKGDFWELKTTRKFNRSLDLDKYDEEKTTIPPDLDPVIMVPKLDMEKFRAIQKGNPELYKRCCLFVISKPAKTSVSVKEVG